jgi:hypothetical protein
MFKVPKFDVAVLFRVPPPFMVRVLATRSASMAVPLPLPSVTPAVEA